MSTFDLTVEKDVLGYLDSKYPLTYDASRIEKISGGNTNFVYRLFLKNEFVYEDVAHSTVVLKYAAGYSATSRNLPLPVERQSYEVAALRYTNKLFAHTDLVKTAVLFEHDPESCVIIMSDAGIGSKTLKELLLTNSLSLDTATRLGKGLGTFLSKLHEHGRSAPEREQFAKHHWARQITAWYYHGRVLKSLKDGVFEPPLHYSDAQLAEIKESVDMMSNLIVTSEETLVMGDFWTGNVSVQLSASDDAKQQIQNVIVLDWEISKLGTPGNDVGQFAAETYLPMVFFPECANAVQALMKSFCAAYQGGVRDFDASLVDIACKQLGSHLIALTPTIPPWRENKPKVRSTVEEGVSYFTGKSQPPVFWFQ